MLSHLEVAHALERTVRWRPDLLDGARLTDAERELAREMMEELEEADVSTDVERLGGAGDGRS